MRQSQEGKEVYLRGGAAGGGGARYIHACYAISYCYLHTCVYSSSVFRNASGACSSSNAHSVVIAPILLGGARHPYWNMGGGGGGSNPSPAPPLLPPLYLLYIDWDQQSVPPQRTGLYQSMCVVCPLYHDT